MWSWGYRQQRRFWRIINRYMRPLFQLLVIVFIFIGCGVSITHAQNETPPNVTDPSTYSSESGDVVPATSPETTLPGNQVVNPTVVTSLPHVMTDATDANTANQALALLAAGTGLAAGAGLARSSLVPMASSGPFTWPPWVHPVSHQIINQQPIFWQRLLQSSTRQVWLTTDSRLEVQDSTIMLQRIDNGRVLAEHPIATIQPGGINFHWEPVEQNETDENVIRVTGVGHPDEHLLEDLDAIEDHYERFLLVQEHRPDLIINQAYPTSESGENSHITMENPLTEIVDESTVNYGFNLGTSDSEDQPHIRSFVINDPQLSSQGEALTYVSGPDGGSWEDARWTIPGTHTLVYEVQYEGQLPQYYTLQQTVVEPHELAAQRLQEAPTPLNRELYLLSLETTLREVEQQEGVDEDRLEQFRESVENANTLLADGGTPLQAVLVTEDTSQAIPLTLFLQQTEDGYAVVDLTNPHPDAARTYHGDTVEEAWQDFLRNNTLPAGQIAATPPSNAATPSDDIWNAHSNGQSTLQQWSNGLGIFSLVALGAGVALMFVPGGQIAGAYVIGAMGASLAAGALSDGLSMVDRARHGNLTWNTQTQVEALGLASSLAGGGLLASAGRQLSVRTIGQGVVALEIVETGADLTSAVIIAREYYQQIESIQNNESLSDEEREAAIQEVLQSAIQLGGLIVLGVGLSRADFNRIQGAINLPDVPSGLRDTINASPILQQILAGQNYNPSALQGLWQTWRNMSGHVPNDFSVWIQGLQRTGTSLETINEFLSTPAVLERLGQQPSLLTHLSEYPALMDLAMNNQVLFQRLLDHRDGLDVAEVVGAAHSAGLDIDASLRLIADAQGFGQLDVVRDMASDGTLTRLLGSGLDDQDVNLMLSDYGRSGLTTLDNLLQGGVDLHRAQQALGIAQEIGQLPTVHDLVTSGNLRNARGLPGFLEEIRSELSQGLNGKLRQLEEAIQRTQQGHEVAIEVLPDPQTGNIIGRSDVIDLTSREAFQMKVITSRDSRNVAEHIRRASGQFNTEVPPDGFSRIIDIRIENEGNRLVGANRSEIIDILHNVHFLQSSDLAGIDELRITFPNTNTTYSFTPDDFR